MAPIWTTAPFASAAASRHSSVVPAVSKGIGCASISMADPGARPHLQTCTPTPARKFGACSTGSRDATCCGLTRPKDYRGVGYRPVEIEAEDRNGRMIQAVTYMARGNEVDGKLSLRYITLLRDGARAHGLPETHIRFLESVEHVQ